MITEAQIKEFRITAAKLPSVDLCELTLLFDKLALFIPQIPWEDFPTERQVLPLIHVLQRKSGEKKDKEEKQND